MREMWVGLLGWEDPLEKEMANHSSILAWKIPWMEEPGRLQSIGLEELDTTSQLNNNNHPKIYHLSHFNSVDLSTFTLLCKQPPRPFPFCKAKLHGHSTTVPLCQPFPHILLSASINVTALGTS